MNRRSRLTSSHWSRSCVVSPSFSIEWRRSRSAVARSSAIARRITHTAITLVYALLSIPSYSLPEIPRMGRRDRLLPDQVAAATVSSNLARPTQKRAISTSSSAPQSDEILAVTGHLVVVPRVVGNR